MSEEGLCQKFRLFTVFEQITVFGLQWCTAMGHFRLVYLAHFLHKVLVLGLVNFIQPSVSPVRFFYYQIFEDAYLLFVNFLVGWRASHSVTPTSSPETLAGISEYLALEWFGVYATSFCPHGITLHIL